MIRIRSPTLPFLDFSRIGWLKTHFTAPRGNTAPNSRAYTRYYAIDFDVLLRALLRYRVTDLQWVRLSVEVTFWDFTRRQRVRYPQPLARIIYGIVTSNSYVPEPT